MRLSILVISRTSELVSRMLSSLSVATSLHYQDVEILCSWNGSSEDEVNITNHSGYEFMIALREKYHFAENMNKLADRARGDLMLFINDDVKLDPGSIDSAIECLRKSTTTGIVGSHLRNELGELTHAGILFDSRHSPYHLLDRLVGSAHQTINLREFAVPAVTGALFLMRSAQFREILFETGYKVCGEDVEICLDLRENLGLRIIFCPKFSGLHASEATRKNTEGQEANSEDLCRIRRRRMQFLENATAQQLNDDLQAEAIQSDVLRCLANTSLHITPNPLQEELNQWQEKCHSLQLTRLRLQQALEQTKQTDTPVNH